MEAAQAPPTWFGWLQNRVKNGGFARASGYYRRSACSTGAQPATGDCCHFSRHFRPPQQRIIV